MRPDDAPAFSADDIRQFEGLFPHLGRALRLRRVLTALRDQRDDLGAALDLLPMAVAILTTSGRLLCANAAAERLIQVTPELRLTGQQLTAVSPRSANAITDALKQTARLADPLCRTQHLRPESPPVVEIPRMDAGPLGLIFMPVRPRHSLRREVASARALVVFHDPSAVTRLNPALIARIHGLTPTEAQLAAAIAQGMPLSQFAEERGCSEQTARTHLKRVLDKTQTRRQPELVRLLLDTAAMHLSPLSEGS